MAPRPTRTPRWAHRLLVEGGQGTQELATTCGAVGRKAKLARPPAHPRACCSPYPALSPPAGVQHADHAPDAPAPARVHRRHLCLPLPRCVCVSELAQLDWLSWPVLAAAPGSASTPLRRPAAQHNTFKSSRLTPPPPPLPPAIPSPPPLWCRRVHRRDGAVPQPRAAVPHPVPPLPEVHHQGLRL
jgi:hypothetical protein